MCSIILDVSASGVVVAANRDEMVGRAWEGPGAYWLDRPGVVAGRDLAAGGTWMGVNKAGVMAAVLNRHGSLGPAVGKRSRGELPLMALGEETAVGAAAVISRLDAGDYRSFNLVVADSGGAFWLKGLEEGAPAMVRLAEGVTMLTAGEANDLAEARIGRYLPQFQAAPVGAWPALLADCSPPDESALNILPHAGFGTVCASFLELPARGVVRWLFCAGAPQLARFAPVDLTVGRPG